MAKKQADFVLYQGGVFDMLQADWISILNHFFSVFSVDTHHSELHSASDT